MPLEIFRDPELTFSNYHVIKKGEPLVLLGHPFPHLNIKVADFVSLNSGGRIGYEESFTFRSMLHDQLLKELHSLADFEQLNSFEDNLLNSRPYITLDNSSIKFSRNSFTLSLLAYLNSDLRALSKEEGQLLIFQHIHLINQLISFHLNEIIVLTIQKFLQSPQFILKRKKLLVTK